MSENGSDYTPITLDDPRIESKDSMTIAGVRRRHRIDGFDFAAFPKQLEEMLDRLPGLTGRVGDRVYDVFWGMFTDLGGRTPAATPRSSSTSTARTIARRSGTVCSTSLSR